MCYSAQIQADYKKMVRWFGAIMDLDAFEKLWLRQNGPSRGRPKVPKAMEDAFAEWGNDDERRIWQAIRAWQADDASVAEQELVSQRTRLHNAQRALETKVTKKAQEDVRVATNKISNATRRLEDLRRTEPLPRDSRIYPGMYAPVVISEGGRRIIRPMRYQCRLGGKPADYDRKFPGTYNARRDSLEKFWAPVFGRNHGVLLVDTFYENVEGPNGENQVIQFTPRNGKSMLVACLWDRWTDPKGVEPDLYSFAAITDEPEPEVAAAGHDRTIINIKPEHLDAWLNPDPNNLAALYAIFDDKQHPFYEHQLAA